MAFQISKLSDKNQYEKTNEIKSWGYDNIKNVPTK